MAIAHCEKLWIFYSVYLYCFLHKELAFTIFSWFYPKIAAFVCIKYLSIQIQGEYSGTIFGILHDFSWRHLFCKGIKCEFGSLWGFVFCFNIHSFTDIPLYYCDFFCVKWKKNINHQIFSKPFFLSSFLFLLLMLMSFFLSCSHFLIISLPLPFFTF